MRIAYCGYSVSVGHKLLLHDHGLLDSDDGCGTMVLKKY